MRRFRHLSSLLFIAAVTLMYNNCGRGTFQTERAYIPNEKLQEDMRLNLQGQVDISICQDSTQYICSRKIFSQDVQDGNRTVDFPCLNVVDGVSLCASGTEHTYNSGAAAEACGENCTDNYEFEEFNCYFSLANMNGSYPIQATADSFQAAISATYSTCLNVVGSN